MQSVSCIRNDANERGTSRIPFFWWLSYFAVLRLDKERTADVCAQYVQDKSISSSCGDVARPKSDASEERQSRLSRNNEAP